MQCNIRVLLCCTILVISWTAVSASVKEHILAAFEDQWKEYQEIFAKTYDDENAMIQRKFLWCDRLLSMFQHNLRADMGLTGFRRGLNSFSDLSTDEILVYLTGYKNEPLSQNLTRTRKKRQASKNKLPRKVDWRDNGSVTPVRNQGTCGSCWAFSSLGSLESLYHIKTGKKVQLSPQNLIDCSTKGGNDGCDGGFMREAFRYIADNGGVDTEKSNRYRGKEGSCDFRRKSVGATCKGYETIPEGDEKALKEAVANVGPVAAAIDASLRSFQEYKDGIYDDKECGKDLVHAVLVVGYGTEDGRDYWLLKNSWGKSWGMKGYMKLLRNADNFCGVASRASYPIL